VKKVGNEVVLVKKPRPNDEVRLTWDFPCINKEKRHKDKQRERERD
jgi:hypothetical protein